MSTASLNPVTRPQEHARSSPDLQSRSQSSATPRAVAARLSIGHENAAGRQNIAASRNNSSASNLLGQRPLPTSPFTPSSQFDHRSLLQRAGSSNASSSNQQTESMDIDASEQDVEGSDHDTENGDPSRASRKKKGQKFFCTEFPPCNLSFTRSEHLARHIRKHTGERPFQCHCNRRFSRLDNLRQHAQTVHLNEEIPAESLAATGTRYNRQIRTERFRTPASTRLRSGDLPGHNNHHRGHGRNLSASSIGSNASSYSTTDPHQRPPPLMVAGDGSAPPSLALETPATPPGHYRAYSTNSPSGTATPTSATYSANPSSPGFGSFTESPLSTSSRVGSIYGGRFNSRRLSVPASASTVPSPHPQPQPHPYGRPLSSSIAQFTSNPTNRYPAPMFPQLPPSQEDPAAEAAAEPEGRRRTWHPSSYISHGSNHPRPATSGLSFSETPDTVQAAAIPRSTGPETAQAQRLPGIESFDRIKERPHTPPRRQPSPMQIDSHSSAAPATHQATGFHQYANQIPDHRRGHFSWDGSRSTRFTRSDHYTSLNRDANAWGRQAADGVHDVTSRPTLPRAAITNYRPGQLNLRSDSQPHVDSNRPQVPPSTPHQTHRDQTTKGRGAHPSGTSPEDSSSSDGAPTPGTSAAESNPVIMHSNGYAESQKNAPNSHSSASNEPPTDVSVTLGSARQSSNYAAQACMGESVTMPANHTSTAGQAPGSLYLASRPRPNHDLGRLEALVAVATNEEKASTVAQ